VNTHAFFIKSISPAWSINMISMGNCLVNNEVIKWDLYMQKLLLRHVIFWRIFRQQNNILIIQTTLLTTNLQHKTSGKICLAVRKLLDREPWPLCRSLLTCVCCVLCSSVVRSCSAVLTTFSFWSSSISSWASLFRLSRTCVHWNTI
jgi:hypothetical protein